MAMFETRAPIKKKSKLRRLLIIFILLEITSMSKILNIQSFLISLLTSSLFYDQLLRYIDFANLDIK